MKYMTTWTIRPENVKAAIARFKETGGQTPAGVTMIGRWHEMGTGRESLSSSPMTPWR